MAEEALLSIGWQEVVQRKFQQPGDIEIGKLMLQSRAGIEITDSLSIDYIDRALGNLVGDSLFPEVRLTKEVNLRALVGLALKVKTRNH